MSKLSLSVEPRRVSPLRDTDRRLAALGKDVRGLVAYEAAIQAWQERYAKSHEDKVEASITKLRIARQGGGALIEMAERGERSDGGRPRSKTTATTAVVSKPTLADLGLSEQRSSRWQAIARLKPAEYERREKALRETDPDAELGSDPHIAANSGENDWYTPPEYVEAARRVMGGVDLDPASTTAANAVLGASEWFGPDHEDAASRDGLARAWWGRVWLNPPYAQPLIWQFSEKLAEEVANGAVTDACALVNNATETAWFQRMAEVAAAICFPTGRVKFWHPDRVSAPLQGQAVLYFGGEVDLFRAEFLRFGFTVAL